MIRLPCFLLALSLFACAHPHSSRGPASDGFVYDLKGNHSRLGPFTGQLELRPGPAGGWRATRVVRYERANFDGFLVEEVWTGESPTEAPLPQIQFQLRNADLFHRVGKLKRTPSDFNRFTKVSYEPAEDRSVLFTVGADQVQEQLGDSRAPEAEPIWEDQRRRLAVRGTSHPVTGAVAMATIFRNITAKYRADSFVQKHRARPECQGEDVYFVLDPTDFDYLRANPEVIRVVNKIVDDISLEEAARRRDAYAPTLQEKAAQFDERFPVDHLNELGVYTGAQYSEQGARQWDIANGDAALWTGMYAGAQAMRWLTTKDEAALVNFRRAVRGLILLQSVTQNPKEFARSAAPIGQQRQQKLPPGWVRGTGPYSRVMYVPGGNNDMVKGLFHGYAWAFTILAADDPLREEVARSAFLLPNLSVNSQPHRVNNMFVARGLAAVASREVRWAKKYREIFRFGVSPAQSLGLDTGFFYGGIADWSGVNLGMVGQTTSILVASLVARELPAHDLHARILAATRQNLIDTWVNYAGSRRDFLTVAAEAFGLRNDLLSLPTETSAQIPEGKENAWRQDSSKAVWSLREIPLPRSPRDVAFDFSRRPDWCASAWPRLPWKALTKDYPMSFYLQSAEEPPIFERMVAQADVIWTNAFLYENQSSTKVRHGRVDFLHLYWMMRWASLVNDQS